MNGSKYIVHFITAFMVLLSVTVNAQNISSQEENVHRMAAHVKNACGSIVSIQSFKTEKQNTIQRVGSGFIYDDMGLIITLGSVIQGGDSILVTLANGRTYYSNIVHYDKYTDIAVLRIEAEGLTKLVLGNASSLVPQSRLVILGNALGVFPSVTMSTYMGKRQDDMLRLTVLVAPGNSGSPVLDMNGKVVGVLIGRVWRETKTKMGTREQGFALPINKIQIVVESLLKSFKKGGGWVGMTVLNLDEITHLQGVRVTKVNSKGPAQQGGICVGDTIIQFEGRKILNSDQLATWVRTASPNSKVAFTVRKSDMEITRLIRVAPVPGLKKKTRQ